MLATEFIPWTLADASCQIQKNGCGSLRAGCVSKGLCDFASLHNLLLPQPDRDLSI